MRSFARRARSCVLVGVLAGCASASKDEPPPRPKPAPAPAPAAAVRSEPAPSGGIVIKGRKRDDDASPPPPSATDEAAEEARQARIAELTRRAAADNVTGDWKDFTSPDRTFRALFPVRPEEKQQSFNSGGYLLTMHAFATNGNEGDDRAFVVEYVDLPRAPDPATLDRMYEGMAEVAAARMHGRVREWRAVNVNGRDGRDTLFEAGGGKVSGRCRACVAGTRLFDVFAFAPTSEIDARDVTRFLDSFEILADSAQVAVAAPASAVAPAPAPGRAFAPAPGRAPFQVQVRRGPGNSSEVSPNDGSFTITFPQPTTLDVKGVGRFRGKMFPAYRVSAFAPARYSYWITWYDVDDAVGTEDLDAIVHEDVGSTGSGVRPTRTFSENVTGPRDVTTDWNNGYMRRERFVAVGKRVYRFGGEYPKGDKGTSDSVDELLGSFKLKSP